MNESDHEDGVQQSPSYSSPKCMKPSGFVSAFFFFLFLNLDDDDQFVCFEILIMCGYVCVFSVLYTQGFVYLFLLVFWVSWHIGNHDYGFSI